MEPPPDSIMEMGSVSPERGGAGAWEPRAGESDGEYDDWADMVVMGTGGDAWEGLLPGAGKPIE